MRAGAYPSTLLKIFGICLALIGYLTTSAVAGSPQPGTFISSTAVAYYQDAKGRLMPAAKATLKTIIGASPYLKLSVTPDFTNNSAAYTITITNDGNQPATDVTLNAQLPPGMTIVSSSPGASRVSTPDGEVLIWKTGILLVGAQETLLVTGKGKSAAPGTFFVSSAEKSTALVAVQTPLTAVKTSAKSAQLTSAISGTVFDSATATPVAGAIVALADASGQPVAGASNPVTTGSNGAFIFSGVADGQYRLVVTPGKTHTFPSVTASEQLPNYTITPASYGRVFMVTSDSPVAINVPVDPLPPTLSVALLANKSKVNMGELVRYSAVVKNIGTFDVTNVSLNTIVPPGFGYIKNSTRMSVPPSSEPVQNPGGLTWTVPVIKAGSTFAFDFVLVAGVGSVQGGGNCSLQATVQMFNKKTASNLAVVNVLVTGGIFTINGTIIGKLQLAKGTQKDLTGIVLYLEDGTRVTTDQYGRFTFAQVSAGIHVVRLLETSLPPDLEVTSGEVTYYAEVVPSGLAKVNIRLAHDPTKSPPKPAIPTPISQPMLPAPPAPVVPPATPVPPPSPDPPMPPNPSTPPPAGPPANPKGTADPPVNESSRNDAPENHVAPEKATSDSTLTKTGAVVISPAELPVSSAPKVPSPLEPLPVSAGTDSAMNAQGRSSFSPPTSDNLAPIAEKESDKPAPQVAEAGSGTAGNTNKIPDDPSVAELTAGLDDNSYEKRIHFVDSTLDFLSPADGLVITDNRRSIAVKGPADADINLFLNGDPINKNAIGKTLVKKKTNTAIYEYIGIILPRGQKSVIRATVVTPFGNEITSKEISVRVTGLPGRIVAEPDRKQALSDGKSLITYTARIVDIDGLLIPYSGAVTISTTKGEIQEKDQDPVTPGLQILGKDGIFTFHIIAPRDSGDATVTLACEGLTYKETVFFSPNLAPLIFSGVGEVVVGYNSRTTPGYGYFNQGLNFDSKGAFFAKGELYNGIMVTTAYDSNKPQQNDFFRADVLNPESEEPYPTYGDDSKTFFETASRDKFYLRLEKDRSYLLYGDYYTNFQTTKLAAYNRTLTGVKTELNIANFYLAGFGSNTDVTKVVDNIAGQGISGYYFLSRSIFSGSERVVLETRDRLQTSRVLGRSNMQRGTDYTIDYQLGALMFKFPVPIRDENMNPVYIVVIYESHNNIGRNYGIYGGRGLYRPTSWLELGATGIIEEGQVGDNTITGADVKFKLPGNTIIRGEWARSTALFDADYQLQPRDGEAWLAEIAGTIIPKINYLGYYWDIGANYYNPTATDVVPGTRKYGAEMKYQDIVNTASFRYFDEHDYVNKTYHRYAGLGAVHSFGLNKVGLLLYNEAGSKSYTQVNASPARTPFDINEIPPQEVIAAKVSFEMPLTPNFSLEGSYRQDLLHNKYNLLQAGASYRLDSKQRLYVREEYGVYSGPDQLRTVAGIEAEITTTTTGFMEYRFSSGSSDGEKNQSSVGVRKRIYVNENLALNLTFENLHSFTGMTSQNYPDVLAATGAVEYQIPERFRSLVKLEYRDEMSSTPQRSYLAETGMQIKTSPDYSLFFRERFFYAIQGQGTRVTARTTLGLAYRPIDNDRFNGLAKLEYRRDQDSITGTGLPTSSDIYLGSLEGIYQVTDRLQTTGKVAAKFVADGGLNTFTNLISGRIVYDIGRNFDCAGEYRLVMNNSQGGTASGGTAEVGYRIKGNLWLSLGYAFDKFDSELIGDSYQGQGPFFRIRMKMDEHTAKNALASVMKQ